MFASGGQGASPHPLFYPFLFLGIFLTFFAASFIIPGQDVGKTF